MEIRLVDERRNPAPQITKALTVSPMSNARVTVFSLRGKDHENVFKLLGHAYENSYDLNEDESEKGSMQRFNMANDHVEVICTKAESIYFKLLRGPKKDTKLTLSYGKHSLELIGKQGDMVRFVF